MNTIIPQNIVQCIFDFDALDNLPTEQGQQVTELIRLVSLTEPLLGNWKGHPQLLGEIQNNLRSEGQSWAQQHSRRDRIGTRHEDRRKARSLRPCPLLGAATFV